VQSFSSCSAIRFSLGAGTFGVLALRDHGNINRLESQKLSLIPLKALIVGWQIDELEFQKASE